MRILESSRPEGMDQLVRIKVLDEPGAGGACHEYRIEEDTDGETTMSACVIKFQKGPVKEAGLNGITQEALLAVVQDRLEGFQSGDFACLANQEALMHVKQALEALHGRTSERVKRGVEGTNEQ